MKIAVFIEIITSHCIAHHTKLTLDEIGAIYGEHKLVISDAYKLIGIGNYSANSETSKNISVAFNEAHYLTKLKISKKKLFMNREM